MGARGPDRSNHLRIEALAAGSGVKITAEEAEAIAGALARIDAAAKILLRASPFDETEERYYRLLESAAAERGR